MPRMINIIKCTKPRIEERKDGKAERNISNLILNNIKYNRFVSILTATTLSIIYAFSKANLRSHCYFKNLVFYS